MYHRYFPESNAATRQLMACEGDKRWQEGLLWQFNDIIRRVKNTLVSQRVSTIVFLSNAKLERVMNSFDIDRFCRRFLFERAKIRDAIEEEIKLVDEDRSLQEHVVAKPKIGYLWADLRDFVRGVADTLGRLTRANCGSSSCP